MKTRITVLTLAIAAVAGASGVALARQPGANHAPHRPALDANGDGAIDRREAAANPRLAAMFDRIDANHDGRLDASERPRWRGHGRRGHGAARGIGRLDADGDGRITRAEAAAVPRLAARFADMDANRDGALVRAEVDAYRARMRPQRMAEANKRFAERFAAADLDRDGTLSRVEVGEKMPRLAKAFAWMDTNRDGVLSRSELQPPRR